MVVTARTRLVELHDFALRVPNQRALIDALIKSYLVYPPALKEPLAEIRSLVYGVPDARRDYSKRYGTVTIPYFHDWTHHSMHFLPVQSCHLCEEAPRGLGSFNGDLTP